MLLHGPRGGRRPADCWTLSIDLGARAVTLQLIAGLESHAPIRPMPTSSLRARFHERRGGGPGRPLNKERLPAPGVRAAGAIRCPCTLSHAPKRADTPFRHAVARLPLLPRWDRRRRRGGVLAPPVTTAQLCPTCHSRTAPRPRSAPRPLLSGLARPLPVAIQPAELLWWQLPCPHITCVVQRSGMTAPLRPISQLPPFYFFSGAKLPPRQVQTKSSKSSMEGARKISHRKAPPTRKTQGACTRPAKPSS